jgi:Zn-dependent protease with chaperone function
VASNHRRAIALCGYTALAPALVVGVIGAATLSPLVGAVAFVACGAIVLVGVWRVAPGVAVRRVGAVRMTEDAPDADPRLINVTEGLCATFGVGMPLLYVLEDPVPNACALGRDARRSALVVTRGLLDLLDPIELEGVVAHELAHVKRGDNGVSSVGITLASVVGGDAMLRRCVGTSREYRADVVGASTVRYPRGLVRALEAMASAPPPAAGSFFAPGGRVGATRWVWIDPSVGHRADMPVAGDLDATSVRVAALNEW